MQYPRILIAVIAFALLPSYAFADLKEDLQAAMAGEARSEAERARDKNRKPVETLEFFGLKADMKVLEMLPGGGWYTKILAPVLAKNGELYVTIGTQRIEALIESGSFKEVKVVSVDADSIAPVEGTRRYGITSLNLDVSGIDLALTFRNLHNFTPSARDLMNKEVFKVLKSGGRYGVIDHTRRHMQKDNDENWRRMDPVQMIEEIESAGFKFVGSSDLHYRFDDELIYEVGRRSVSGNTDRFTLLFEKP
ncbi:MAG: class I SAM-dependent methyltransferase [Gammaproteobacteria bacterium]|nr:class I SAM-dependent methyltransferase [Gammaproteobacteria bacterium]